MCCQSPHKVTDQPVTGFKDISQSMDRWSSNLCLSGLHHCHRLPTSPPWHRFHLTWPHLMGNANIIQLQIHICKYIWKYIMHMSYYCQCHTLAYITSVPVSAITRLHCIVTKSRQWRSFNLMVSITFICCKDNGLPSLHVSSSENVCTRSSPGGRVGRSWGGWRTWCQRPFPPGGRSCKQLVWWFSFWEILLRMRNF